jgi:hypothetical protein
MPAKAHPRLSFKTPFVCHNTKTGFPVFANPPPSPRHASACWHPRLSLKTPLFRNESHQPSCTSTHQPSHVMPANSAGAEPGIHDFLSKFQSHTLSSVIPAKAGIFFYWASTLLTRRKRGTENPCESRGPSAIFACIPNMLIWMATITLPRQHPKFYANN